MDISSLLTPQNLSGLGRLPENTLNLKVGQKLDAKVINADITAAKNTIALAMGGKNVAVQSNQPIRLNPGQDIKIQVTQITPTIEFKVLGQQPEAKTQTTQPQDPKNQADQLRLKLVPAARQDGAASPSPAKLPIAAKIISVTGTKIQLQFAAPVQLAANPGNKPVAMITIDRAQISNAPSDLKAGQSLNLEIGKTGPTPEFKIVPAPPPLAAQITGINGNKIQLAVQPPTNGANKQPALLIIDRAQLTNAPPNLKVGQSLNLEMTKTGATPEFKVILPALPLDAKVAAIDGNKIQLQIQPAANTANKQPTLITIDRAQLANAPSDLKVGQGLSLEVTKTEGSPEYKVILPATQSSQPLDAKVTGISGNKIQLQIFPQPAEGGGNKQPVQITIDRSQLGNAPSDLKVGQNLALEIVKTDPTPEFKVISAANKIPEAKVAEFMKQFLPRHEASPILLNQLIKDLPKLMENKSVPQALKDIAAKIIQNLPPKEQLITSQGLKQAIVNSGLFLEAKLPPVMAQAGLINDLPQLIKNETVPQSLQRIAAEILQNLAQKQPASNSPDLKPQAINQQPPSDAELTPSKLSPVNNPGDVQPASPKPGVLANAEPTPQKMEEPGQLKAQLPGAAMAQEAEQLKLALPIAAKAKEEGLLPGTQKLGALPDAPDKAGLAQKKGEAEQLAGPSPKALMQGASSDDFKANLLKFIHALKQDISLPGEQQLTQTDLDLLKNLQNKTENTVAKIVLDQLMSLPKEDNPKQQWIIDIPFTDRQQAESVKIEIQRDKDKENKHSSGSSDWLVNITITPPGLGTIHCIVSYQSNVINTFFKSLNTKTTDLIKHNLDYLKNQLEESGLTTGHLDAHVGAQISPPPHHLAGKKLFDDKA